MRILYLTQYYVTPDQPGSLRHYTHAYLLHERGHDVSVISTYLSHKQQSIPEKYRGRGTVTEWERGMPVYRVYAAPTFGGFAARMWNYLTFMLNAVRAGIKIREKPDVVFASSPSLFVGLAGYLLGRRKRARLILEVRDLWPRSAIDLGFLRNPVSIWLSRRLEAFLYKRAWRIVATTEGIRRDIQGRITDPGKVFTVPNGVEDELYRKAAPYGVCSELRTALGEGFLAVYAGAHGVNNSLDLLIDAAELLREERRIRFVLVGSGSETPALVQRSQEKGLSNVVFTGAVPKSQVPSYLMCADVLLWPVLWDASRQSLRDLKEGACPNKVYDYLAAGKPVVATTPPASEGARLLEQFEAGIVVEPSASALCDALLELLEDEERRTSFGKRREEAIARFGRTRTGAVLERVISGASDQTPGSGNTGPKI